MKSPVIKNILAVLAGLVIGMLVNGTLGYFSTSIVNYPPGVDGTNIESIKANLHLFEGKHYVIPFLAHAIGTLVGAIIASKLCANKPFVWAMLIGLLFLVGGILNAKELGIVGIPLWVDLVLAYFPFAYFGYKIGGRK